MQYTSTAPARPGDTKSLTRIEKRTSSGRLLVLHVKTDGRGAAR